MTVRSTSWLDSTQVGGAPDSAMVARVESITVNRSPESHADCRNGKLNAVWSWAGTTYLASRSGSATQASATKIRGGS
ncbi:hypothetical protein GCM10020001_103970 [Nonomuraea salmonea]